MKVNFILYVSDQQASTEFYSAVLGLKPSLEEPGMTEFQLSEDGVLGLMPATGIKRLLDERLPDPTAGSGVPKAEVYLWVDDAQAYHDRSLANGARELSELLPRDWGHDVAYSLDRDGHVLAFGQSHRNVS